MMEVFDALGAGEEEIGGEIPDKLSLKDYTRDKTRETTS